MVRLVRLPRGARLLVTVAVAAMLATSLSLLLVVVADPAAAHPGSGMTPPHARLSAEGSQVHVHLSAPPDDAAHIGEELGLLPAGSMEAFLVGPEEALPTEQQVRAMAASTELAAYLLDNVTITQDGRECPGEVEPAETFLDDGARFTFLCDRTVSQVDVRVTVLQDIDPAYDTFGVDGTIWTVLFSSASPVHTWDATAAASGSSPPIEWVVGLVTVIILALVWIVWTRRTRHLRRSPRNRDVADPHRRSARSRGQRRRSAGVR